MTLHRTPRETMVRNHAEYRARRALPAPPATRLANVQAVLELDQTVYVLFRGRSFGVPPVGWKTGAKLLALRMQASEVVEDGKLTAKRAEAYFAVLRAMADALWSHARPCGRLVRLAKRLRLLRNPFLVATESEVIELVDFFLQRRMTSSVSSRRPARLQPSET